ncbi:helix-turn-helix transcriptional regulator [Hyphomicrobium sp.]|uniref:helix-turn-helix domain-containing protein n=1 Tax=Hyphomicrobium sp. TaxID=82 RepID=UPI001DAD6F0E|nr:helix-turn-helix transcriptional regulator [Hyphomicrobium sp.]MBY0559992.1 helix-turn-helix domain-containing protein [Hyphomicrobium sp.]
MDNFWGQLVKKLREEQGVSQRVLASRTEVGRSALRRLEAGGAPGTIDVIERLLDYLGYELEAIKREDHATALKDQAQAEADTKRRSRIALNRILAISL